MSNDSVSNIRFTPDKGDDHRTKSAPLHKTKKDFKKVLAREAKEEHEHSDDREKIKGDKSVKAKEDYETVAHELKAHEGVTDKKKVSLFDLSASQVEEEAIEEAFFSGKIPDPVKKESLSALFQGYGTKDKLALLQKQENARLAAEGKAAKSPSSFSQEHPDLAAVNPMAGVLGTTASSAVQQGPQPAAAARMQEIIDQIVKELQLISSEGKTQTMITLKHPPMFAGVNIVITSYATAKGEFNIAFENLTQAAKQLLDLQDNQNALKSGLTQKGFAVHILTTTTLSETVVFAEGKAPQREGEEGQGDTGQGRQEEKRENKDE